MCCGHLDGHPKTSAGDYVCLSIFLCEPGAGPVAQVTAGMKGRELKQRHVEREASQHRAQACQTQENRSW